MQKKQIITVLLLSMIVTNGTFGMQSIQQRFAGLFRTLGFRQPGSRSLNTGTFQGGYKGWRPQQWKIKTAALAGVGLAGGAYWQRPTVQAEEEKKEQLESILATKPGPVNPIVTLKAQQVEQPVAQPTDFVLSKFIPQKSEGNRLLNQTYFGGQMVIDEVKPENGESEYRIFIHKPELFFILHDGYGNKVDSKRWKFFVNGDKAVVMQDRYNKLYPNVGILFPDPLAKDSLNREIDPTVLSDGTWKLVFKKDPSYNEDWLTWGKRYFFNMGNLHYWAFDRKR